MPSEEAYSCGKPRSVVHGCCLCLLPEEQPPGHIPAELCLHACNINTDLLEVCTSLERD